MTAQDPQRMTGQTYPPPMSRCIREGCGDLFAAHLIDKRKPHGRGKCSRWGRREKCECPQYIGGPA